MGAACSPSCAESVALINRLVVATSVVGAVSVAACLVVVLAIVAYSKDVYSLRDRIVVGLMIANAV
jgi:hypothetical protein